MQPKTTVWESQSSLQLWRRFRMLLPAVLKLQSKTLHTPGRDIMSRQFWDFNHFYKCFFFCDRIFVKCTSLSQKEKKFFVEIWWVKNTHTATYFEASKMSQDHQCKQLQVLGETVTLCSDYWSGWLDIKESPNRSAIIYTPYWWQPPESAISFSTLDRTMDGWLNQAKTKPLEWPSLTSTPLRVQYVDCPEKTS